MKPNKTTTGRAAVSSPDKYRRRQITYLSAVIPLICMLIIYAIFQVFPFGDRTVLVMDLNGQYADYMMYYHRVLTGGDSLFYSFTKEMGGNVFGLFSYYLASPFCLILVLFPASKIPEAVALMTLLKISASGLTFSLFLQYTFKKSSPFVVLCSCAYALMTYSMHYSMCIMWLDGVIWLPVILLGVERMLDKKSPAVFLFAYTLSLISNYYTGYMNTLFTAIWFFYRYFTRDAERSAKDFFIMLGKIVGCGAVGLLLSVGVLFPTFMDILQGKLSGSSAYVPEGFWNSGIFNIGRRLFIGQYDTITNDGNPNIFCGVLCAMMSLLYFFNPKIKVRKIIGALAVYLLFFVGFFVMRLDMVWHIFLYPTWYPYRYAYVFNFFSVMLAFVSLSSLHRTKWYTYASGVAVYLLALLYVLLFQKSVLTNENLAKLTIVFAVGYGLLAAAMKFFKDRKLQAEKAVAVLLIVLTCAELILNGYTTIMGLNGQFAFKSHSEYEERVETMTDAVASVQEKDGGFYRMEKTISRTDNDSMSFGYNGMTHYSSTYNSSVVDFNNKMGMLQEFVLIRYLGSTMLTDSLLGVKYVVADTEVSPAYETYKNTETYRIYENPYALSVGFAAPESALETPVYSGDYLANQNAFAQSLLGEAVLEPVADVQTPAGTGGVAFTAARDGVYYVEFAQKYAQALTLAVNGAEVPYQYEQGHEKKIYCLGTFAAGDGVQVGIQDMTLAEGASVYVLDTDRFAGLCKEKQQNGSLQVTDYGHTWLEGEFTLEDGQLLFTTIPYEKGWKVYVDGKEVDASCAQGTFLAVEASAGTHTLRMKYSVPGLKASMTVSVVTLLGVLAVMLYQRRRKKKNNCSGQPQTPVV